MIIKRANYNYQQVDENTKRMLLSYNDELMSVRLLFNHPTKEVELHQHIHVQSTYVLKGKFKFFIEENEFFLEEGDSILFGSNVPHGCIILEENSELLDTFTPIREDFL